MFSWLKGKLRSFFGSLRELPDYTESPERYKILRRNIVILMLVVTILPLVLMGLINHYLYRQTMHDEIVQPLKILVNKTKHSFELFLAERLSAVSFIASSHTCAELADNHKLSQIFSVMKREFSGVVDLGFLDPTGVQVSYDGPYQLRGKNYVDQDWYKEVRVRGSYTSDVFLGYRRLPHIVMAVERSVAGTCLGCVLRATIDTNRFMELIAAMRLDPASDAFLINKNGVLQTPSKFYGQVLETFPLPLPPLSYEPNVLETQSPDGQDVMLTYAYFESHPFILMLVKPRSQVMQAWYTLKTEAFFVFAIGVIIIFLVIFKLTDKLVRRLEESDHRREVAYREMQETSKLASIGRLAAGVAHEINNPLAIINEKAGLLKDLTELSPDFPQKQKERLLPLTGAILHSVDRCRTITQRLLGFARRMDISVELLNVNEVIEEVLGFLEKEALHRNIDLQLNLAPDLPRIASDRGQLQQVFLNILNNAFDAVRDGGQVSVTSFEVDMDTIGVSIQDNGQGMTQETMAHLFEPFFTTKKGYGTGLGLSITYGIVKKLGGDIRVVSQLGEGSTFTVFLPKKAALSGE